MKKLMFSLFIFALCSSTLVSCSDDSEDEKPEVQVGFLLKNTLLWHIGHDYKVAGTGIDGKAFTGPEKYVQYVDVLLDGSKIEYGSKLTLYRDGNILWTSDPINKSCTITYNNDAFQDKVSIE